MADTELGEFLGYTRDAYRAMKRRVIENIGITVKGGPANEKLAASVGKAVTELTDVEKKQAYLNAVLDSNNEIEEGGIPVTITIRIGRATGVWYHCHYPPELMGPLEKMIVQHSIKHGDLEPVPPMLVSAIDKMLLQLVIDVKSKPSPEVRE